MSDGRGIEIEGVHHAEGGTPILHDVSLSLPAGGVTALIGPNGAGKSTLLSLVARLRPLRAGRIRVDGLDVSRTATERLALKLAILRQDTAVGSRLTVRELVGFGRFPHHRGRPGPEDRAAVEAALERLELGALAERQIDALSGGQRQRALVAMAFAQETDWLLLDEPLASLDMAHARRLMRLLRESAARGERSVAVVVHDINYAAAHADRIVALKNGRVFAQGTPEEMLAPERLGALYDTPVEVRRIDGRPVVLHHG